MVYGTGVNRKAMKYINLLIIGLTIVLFFMLVKAEAKSDDPVPAKLQGFGEKGFCVQITSDGGYIAASFCISGKGDRDLYLLKCNAQGKKEWEKCFGGDQDDQANWVQEIKDGGFIVCGYTESRQGKGKDLYLLKVDKQGQVIWEKNYGGRLKEEKEAEKEKKEYELGFEVFDYNSSSGRGQDYYDVFLMREDKGSDDENGSSEYTEDEAYYVQSTSDGGYIMAGYSRPKGKPSDLCLVKVDAQGVLRWAKTIGGGKDEEANSLQQTVDGGYIAAGYTRSVGLGSRTRGLDTEGKEREDKDVYLIKVDANGYLQWEQTYGGVKDDEAAYVETCADGSYMICGYTGKPSTVEGVNLYLMKTSSSGSLIWQQNAWAGQGSAVGTSVKQLANGNFIISGNTSDIKGVKTEIFVSRIGPNGEYQWNRYWKSTGDAAACQAKVLPYGVIGISGKVSSLDSQSGKKQTNPLLLQYDENGKLRRELILTDHMLCQEAGSDVSVSTTSISNDLPPVPQAKGTRNGKNQ